MKNSKWNKELVIKTIKNLDEELKRRPTKWDNCGLYQASRKHFGTWNNAMKIAGYKIPEKQNPVLPEKLTPELAYFLGLLITDGHIQSDNIGRKYKTSLYTSYKEEIEVICSLIKSLFKCKAKIYERKHTGFSRKNNYDIYIHSKMFVEYLKNNYDIPSGAKSLTIKIPKFILNTSKKNMVAFLRGVIDGDGSIKKWSVNIASGSYSFLKSIKYMLNKLRIDSNKIYKDRTCMTLSITKNKNLNKLYSLIYSNASAYYPRKKSKFETAILKNA